VVIIASSLFLDIQTLYVVSTVVIIASSLFLDIQTFYVVSTVVIIASSLFMSRNKDEAMITTVETT
jgi:hypothetical protein